MKPNNPATPTSSTISAPNGRALTLMLFAIALTWPMFYNGFPLVFSDTGTYIAAMMEGWIPVDRPIYYSCFLVFTSNLLGLYSTPFVQGLCVSYVILVFFNCFAPCASTAWRLFLIGTITVLTPAPWLASWLMPDVFGAMVILIPILFAFASKRIGSWVKLFLFLILLLTLLTHNGNFILFGLFFVVVVGVALWLQRRLSFEGFLLLASAGVLSCILLLLPNIIAFGRWTMSPGSQAFIASRLVGDGMMQSYLARHCPKDPNQLLCDQQSELDGLTSNEFLWGESSIAARTGAWRERAADYRALNSQIITENRMEFLRQGVKNTFSLLQQTELANDPVDDNFRILSSRPMTTIPRIKKYFPAGYPKYMKSLQQRGLLHRPIINSVHRNWTVLSYGLLLTAAFLACKRKQYELLSVVIVIILGLVLNAAVHGVLSGVYTRYQVKVTWIATLGALTVLAALQSMKTPTPDQVVIQKP